MQNKTLSLMWEFDFALFVKQNNPSVLTFSVFLSHTDATFVLGLLIL